MTQIFNWMEYGFYEGSIFMGSVAPHINYSKVKSIEIYKLGQLVHTASSIQDAAAFLNASEEYIRRTVRGDQQRVSGHTLKATF